MFFRRFNAIFKSALVSICWSLTALAASGPLDSKPRFIFLGEDHDDPTQNRLFCDLINDLASQKRIDTVGTELVPETLNIDFQSYLAGDFEEDQVFFRQIKVNSQLRPNFEAKLKSLFRLNKQFHGQIKFCGIEVTSVQHLSDDPKEQRALAQARLKLIDRHIVESASRTMGINIRSVPDSMENFDREAKMVANALECFKGSNAMLIHVGSGHSYREDRTISPGWRTMLDLLEDFITPTRAVSIKMDNVSHERYRQTPELDEVYPLNLIPAAAISENAHRMLGGNSRKVDFILLSREPFERKKIP